MKYCVKKAQSRLIAHALKNINPELYELCMAVPKPILTNYKHIEFVLYEFEHQFGKLVPENKTIFIGCVYRLYNPTHLYGMFNKAPIGLRDEIARVMQYHNPENINAFLNNVPAYYKNHRTAKLINDFADNVYTILKECDELCPDERDQVSAQVVFNIKKYMPSSDIKPVNRYLTE